MTARLSLVAIVLLCTATASAGPFDLYGISGRGQAMGNAMVAAADDWSAAYYNPALLTEKQTFSFGAGFALNAPSLKINTTNPVATSLPPTYDSITVGFLFPIGGKIHNRVEIGVLASVPLQSFLRVHFEDAAVPHFYMYDTQPGTFEMYPTIGIRIFDWLSIGGGVRVLAGMVGKGTFTLDISNNRLPAKDLQVDLNLSPAAVAGITIKPFKGFKIGLSYRGEQSLPIALPNTLNIQGLDAQLVLDIHGMAQWNPHMFDFGVSYFAEPAHLMLAAMVEYALWSRAPDPTVFLGVKLTGTDVAKAGLSGVLDTPAPGNERYVNLGMSDTLSVRAGLEYTPAWFFALRAGYAYRPTPLPVQTSGTNILDNDSHTLSAGLGFQFHEPLGIFPEPVSFDLTGQLSVLPSRLHTKETTDDPVGNLSAGGIIYGFSAAIRYTYGP